MCNLYRLRSVERWEIAEATGADETWARSCEVEKDYVAPGGPGYVVRYEEGRRVLDGMRWGYPNPESGKKKAHWFSVPSRRVFTFAGAWRHTDKGPVFAFLTCGYEDDNPAAHIVGRIYPKACPVILHKEDEERWLTGKLDRALSLAWAYPSQLISVE
ncbi:DUF159 family protein [Sphingomonadaceae bacterium G21617-S1]|nr:DUF159 family protein [Sphingomonadaceae bacterium G21617-S1]